MANRVVIGSQWGDEGKAKVVDFLTEDADVIVRFQGGANAGHTVLVGDQTFIFHLIPSGIMHPGKICVIGNGVVLDPVETLNEIEDLAQKGISVEGRLVISDCAHVVLPYHKRKDVLKEKMLGKQAIGTTGRGIGPCYSDKVNRLGLRVGDLLDFDHLSERIQQIASIHNRELQAMFDDEGIDPTGVIEEFYALGQKLKPFVQDTSILFRKAIKENKRFIFEGAQGTILDVDHGTYPFVTSSNTIAGAACCGSGLGPKSIDHVIGVVKAYTTRVGNGPFPTEQENETGEQLRSIGHEFGATTGRRRRCGWFDAPVVRKAALVNGLTHLAMTKMDVLDSFDTIRICTHYEIDSEIVEVFPSQLSVLNKAVPIYEEMPGWNSDTTHCRKWEELPKNAQNYLNRLAELVEVPIGMVSLGPKRDQSIIVNLD